jgi:hypothetical protein
MGSDTPLRGYKYLGFVAAGRRWDVASIGVTRRGSELIRVGRMERMGKQIQLLFNNVLSEEMNPRIMAC